MFEVSDAFKELMKSNVRPKCEPTITVKDALGIGRDLVWSGKNITKMTYKRGIDPIGRTLPFMELRWTEIYQGKLNANSYPQIYENVAAFLPVELKIEQRLGFFNTWKIIIENGLTWKNIFENFTWKSLKKDASKQEVIYPTLFLSGKPTVKNNMIEWVAYDLMHYMDTTEKMTFDEHAHRNKVLALLVLNSCSSHLFHKDIISGIKASIDHLDTKDETPLGSDIIFDGKINSLMKDYSSVFSRYWDFKENKVIEKDCFDSFFETEFDFPLYLQYEKPTITKNSNISSYQFKKYYIQKNEDKTYVKKWDSYSTRFPNPIFGEDQDVYVFNYVFDKYGIAPREGQTGISYVFSGVDRAIGFLTLKTQTVPSKDDYSIKVVPIEYNSVDFVLELERNGEAFVENNSLSIYGKVSETDQYGNRIEKNHPNVEKRKENLLRYFNEKADSIEMKCAPNVALETGDIISVETDLYDNLGERITKKAVIVENTLEYSGKMSQTIKAHEVSLYE